MLCSCHLEILSSNVEHGAPCFHFALGPTKSEASTTEKSSVLKGGHLGSMENQQAVGGEKCLLKGDKNYLLFNHLYSTII